MLALLPLSSAALLAIFSIVLLPSFAFLFFVSRAWRRRVLITAVLDVEVQYDEEGGYLIKVNALLCRPSLPLL